MLSARDTREAVAATPRSRWLVRPRRGRRGDRPLFCVPYAGGGVQAFRGWSRGLPDWIDLELVALPGRGRRLREPPLRRIAGLAAGLVGAIEDHVRAPVALFGHSMGALVAFEAARSLEDRGLEVERLFVAACAAPHRLPAGPPLRDLPDDEFVEALARLRGIPDRLMEEPEVLRMALPALRADIEAAETYRADAGARVDCPVVAFGGEDDRAVARGDLEAWSAHTSGSFDMRLLAGGHFFLQTSRSALVRAVAEELESRGEVAAGARAAGV
jgi:medium-chain acyl-[acyl-carrier-protein] hydrolase